MTAPGAQDIQRWNRLIKLARRQARVPLSPLGDLIRAGDRAAKAVTPPGYCNPDSPFVALTRGAQALGRVDRAALPAEIARLGELAEACARVLETCVAPPLAEARGPRAGAGSRP